MITQESLDALQALIDAGEPIKMTPFNKRLLQGLVDGSRWRPLKGFPTRTPAIFGYWTPTGIWKTICGIKTPKDGVLHGGKSTKWPTHVLSLPAAPRRDDDPAS